MSRPPCPAPVPVVDAGPDTGPDTGLGTDLLAALAEVVDGGLSLQRSDPARLIRIRTTPPDGGDGDGDEIELGFRPIDPGRHPLDELVGFIAPADWAAIGLAATGVAAPLDGGPPFPVRSVHLVDRTGAWASSWHPLAEADGGESTGERAESAVGSAGERAGSAGERAESAVGSAGECGGSAGECASSATEDEPPTGRVDDALRRAIGVATAPSPPGGTLLLWTVVWLDGLLATVAASASRRRRSRTLPALLGAHPAVKVLGLDPATLDVDQLVAEGRRLAGWRDWTQLRRACAIGAWSTPDVDAATAAWLDDGSFARWLLGTRPDLDDLHDALAALLVPSALTVVDDVLAGWNLLPEHGPPVPVPERRGQ